MEAEGYERYGSSQQCSGHAAAAVFFRVEARRAQRGRAFAEPAGYSRRRTSFPSGSRCHTTFRCYARQIGKKRGARRSLSLVCPLACNAWLLPVVSARRGASRRPSTRNAPRQRRGPRRRRQIEKRKHAQQLQRLISGSRQTLNACMHSTRRRAEEGKPVLEAAPVEAGEANVLCGTPPRCSEESAPSESLRPSFLRRQDRGADSRAFRTLMPRLAARACSTARTLRGYASGHVRDMLMVCSPPTPVPASHSYRSPRRSLVSGNAWHVRLPYRRHVTAAPSSDVCDEGRHARACAPWRYAPRPRHPPAAASAMRCARSVAPAGAQSSSQYAGKVAPACGARQASACPPHAAVKAHQGTVCYSAGGAVRRSQRTQPLEAVGRGARNQTGRLSRVSAARRPA